MENFAKVHKQVVQYNIILPLLVGSQKMLERYYIDRKEAKSYAVVNPLYYGPKEGKSYAVVNSPYYGPRRS